MRPEKQARQLIDEQLAQANWIVQNYKRFKQGASLGVAIREFSIFPCTKNIP